MKKIKQTELKKEEKAVNLFIQKTSEINKIKCVEDLTRADEIRIKIKEKIEILESERKEITAPLNESLKVVNDRYKTLTVPLKELKEKIEKMILDYRRIEEEKRLEEEARLIEMSGNELATITNSVPAIIETKLGSTSFIKKWTFKIVDVSKISRKYLMVDETKIKEAISSGEREIKGVEIFQIEEMRTRK